MKGHSRSDAGSALGPQRSRDGKAKSDHWTVFRGLLPFVWPAGRPDLRSQVVLAFLVLALAKVVTVFIPVVFKEATDWLTENAPANGEPARLLAFGAMGLIGAYGAGRVLMMGLNQIRDVLFTKVGQHAARELNNRTFRHLHQLSLRFHLERRTGGLSRVIERGTHQELLARHGYYYNLYTMQWQQAESSE